MTVQLFIMIQNKPEILATYSKYLRTLCLKIICAIITDLLGISDSHVVVCMSIPDKNNAVKSIVTPFQFYYILF